ncbi:MAG: AAA family ATPase [Burkholderiales bacterium]
MRPLPISDWLKSIGLEPYAPLFEENGIDLVALPLISDADLQALGVVLGHRRRILNAISQLSGASDRAKPAANTQSVPETTPTPQVLPVSGAVATAERRQLTILFCDLVGSTALSQQLDPERLRELMQSYQQACRTVIERYEGHVAQYLGDGLMVYFGWPRAHEDDAERAVRSAMELIDVVKAVPSPHSLQVRIGIATGSVVVGETGAGDASVPKLAVGETPNLAARLQGLAGPDEIVIAPSTQRLAGWAFTYAGLGPQVLKGILEAVQPFRVTGSGKAEGRFDAAHGQAALTPLVGRDSELALMQERWAQVLAGEGQLVLLSGEPGIGKSRVTQALRQRIEGQTHQRLRYQCSPYHTQSALHPMVEHLERAAGFAREDTPPLKIDKLEALLQPGGQALDSIMPLFAALLSLPAEKYPALNFSPQKQKEKLLEALVEQIGGLARTQPVLMVFEDVHWVDPTTQEALDLLVSRIARWRVMLLITHRTEYTPRWSGEAHVTAITLNRFNPRLGALMAEKVTGGKPLPAQVIELIVAKTDGIPLFVEELTKYVIEAGFLKDAGTHYELDGPLPPLAIPSTLHDSLMARLDRLAPVKEVAQVGACIGREFSYELLAAISPMNERTLDEALKQLVLSQLVYQQGAAPQATYTFKHALVQDAAYGSLLKSRRQVLHKNIAETLEQRFPERVAHEPEVVAHHYTEAGLNEQATDYWLKAGQRGVERFANAEAITHLTRGLKTLEALPPGKERDQRELLLQINLGLALGNSKGYSPPEVGQAFGRAKDLCDQVGDTPQMFSTLGGLWLYYAMRAEYVTSEKLGNQILDLAGHSSVYHHVIAANNIVGINSLFTGKIEIARDYFEAGFEAYEKSGSLPLGRVYGFDHGINCCEWVAWALMILGFGERSRERYDIAIRTAHRHAEPLAVATTLVHHALFNMLCEDPVSALTNSREAAAFCRENRILLRQIEAEMIEGCALADLGQPAEGLRILQPAINVWAQLGAKIWDPGWYSALARVQAQGGRIDLAREAMHHAFDAAETTGEHLYLADMHRLDGDLRLFVMHPDAESCYREAIRLARQQKAKLFEIRASTSLAGLLQSQDKCREAYDLLAPVYNWFTEGFDTKKLKEAKALLDSLAHP